MFNQNRHTVETLSYLLEIVQCEKIAVKYVLMASTETNQLCTEQPSTIWGYFA